MAVRRKLSGHRNYDLTCGIDLTDEREVRALFQYLSSSKVFCVIMGPPCTAFGPWISVNMAKARTNPFMAAKLRKTRRIGTQLANLAADIAIFQLKHGRHFVAENPHSSQLWKLPSWKRVLARPNVARAVCDQCMKGLTTPHGLAKKPTSFVASDESLVWRLRTRCNRQHRHVMLEGSLTTAAQTWPQQICRDIVDGVLECKLREKTQ